jgi:thiol-disulfide isomerase/thioredoxin
MRIISRRAGLLALAGTAGTLASAAFGRKLMAASTVDDDDDEPDLADMSKLKLANPPMPLPPISFSDAQGNTHRVADFQGHGMVINLWATWCSPCVAEMPSLEKLSRAVAKDDIAVMPLSSDRGGADVVENFFAKNNIRALPVLLDPSGAAAGAFHLPGIPTTLIVDRNGQERARMVGSANWGSPEAIALVRRLANG